MYMYSSMQERVINKLITSSMRASTKCYNFYHHYSLNLQTYCNISILSSRIIIVHVLVHVLVHYYLYHNSMIITIRHTQDATVIISILIYYNC